MCTCRQVDLNSKPCAFGIEFVLNDVATDSVNSICVNVVRTCCCIVYEEFLYTMAGGLVCNMHRTCARALKICTRSLKLRQNSSAPELLRSSVRMEFDLVLVCPLLLVWCADCALAPVPERNGVLCF